MPQDFNTKLSTLIFEAQSDEKIIIIDRELTFNPANGILIPPAFMAIAAQKHDIQLLRDTLGPVYKDNKSICRIKSFPGRNPNHTTLGLLFDAALTRDAILFFYFDEWAIQSRNKAMIVVAVGVRHVELVKGYLIPILDVEEKQHQKRVIVTREEAIAATEIKTDETL
jgi:hypothetical protein